MAAVRSWIRSGLVSAAPMPVAGVAAAELLLPADAVQALDRIGTRFWSRYAVEEGLNIPRLPVIPTALDSRTAGQAGLQRLFKGLKSLEPAFAGMTAVIPNFIRGRI